MTCYAKCGGLSRTPARQDFVDDAGWKLNWHVQVRHYLKCMINARSLAEVATDRTLSIIQVTSAHPEPGTRNDSESAVAAAIAAKPSRKTLRTRI